jgi:hypothetical protein
MIFTHPAQDDYICRPRDHSKSGQLFPFFQFISPSQTFPQLSLGFWELAKNRNVQERLRTEIMETLGKIRARGDSDFIANDFDSMPYLLAVGKVRPKQVC